MPDDLQSRLERERADADRAYNDALTAFDRARLPAAAPPPLVDAGDSLVPELPTGLLGRWLRPVAEWLAPSMRRQDAVNARLAAAVNAAAQRDAERTAAFDGFQAALIQFLQRITAFVETKERQAAANAAAADAVRLETVRDLQAQVAVLQRATQMLTRKFGAGAAPAAGAPALVAPTATDHDDYKYVAFEDQFRGSLEDIRAKQATYVPLFAGASNVLDIGCGQIGRAHV